MEARRTLKYEAVLADLRGKIESGTYAADSKLPSTQELCAAYGVSRITVNKAMGKLEQIGLIARKQGSGTFVKHVMTESSDFSRWSSKGTGSTITGVVAEYSARGIAVTSTVYDFSVSAPPESVARNLGMDEGFTYFICRRRELDGRPSCVEYTYMPISLIPDLRREHVEGSIYHYIESELGLEIASAHSVIRAANPTEQEQEWLDVEAGYPLLEVEQVAYLANGRAFEYSVTRHLKFTGEVQVVRLH